MDGRWDSDLWTGGVPTRFVDVLINATGGPYTIIAPATENIARARSMLLDSDDATLIFDGDDNNQSGVLSVHMHDLTLRRGNFIADNARFTPGTDVILDGANVTFGSVSFGNNAYLTGLAHQQSTDFDINFTDLSFLQTDLGTVGNAIGELSVGMSVDEETTTVLSVSLTGQGGINVRDGRGSDDSHLVIGETGRTTGWSMSGVRITNHGTIATQRNGADVRVSSDNFTNFGTILAEGSEIEWTDALVNHGEMRAVQGGDFVGESLVNHGSLRLEPTSILRTTDDFSFVENTGEITIFGNGEIATARFENSGSLQIDIGILRTGYQNPVATDPTFSNTGTILLRNGATLFASNTRLSLLGDITTESGARVAFGSLDLEGATISDLDQFGGAFYAGGNGTIRNGAIDFGGRSDAFISQSLGNFPGTNIGEPTATTFQDITLSNGTLGGARFTLGNGITFNNIDLDLSAGIARVVGDVNFDGRLITSDGGPLEIRIFDSFLTLEAGASIEAPYAEIEFGFTGGNFLNKSDLVFGGDRLSTISGNGSFVNQGSFATSGEFFFQSTSFLNTGTVRVLEGGEITVSSAPSFGNFGTIAVDRDALFRVSGNTPFELTLSGLGDVDRHRNSVIHLLNARLDLEGRTVLFDPSSGERGGAFHGLFMAREFHNGQLGVDGGGVRIGFGASPEPSRIENARLRGLIEFVHDGSHFGNAVGMNLSIGADVDMAGSTLLFSYSDASNSANVTFEGELDADIRVEFTPGTQSPHEYVFLNRNGTLRIADDLSLTGSRFAFGSETAQVINDGLIATDGPSGAVLGRIRSFGGTFSDDFTLVNNGTIDVGAGTALAAFGGSLINHGEISVGEDAVLTLSALLDNRGAIAVSGEGSRVRFFRSSPVSIGDFTLADGAAAEFATDTALADITSFTRIGETSVRIERGLELGGGTMSLANTGGRIILDGGEIRNGVVDLAPGNGLLSFEDQGGFERADDDVREFLSYRHNALTELDIVGGDAVLETQVLLRGTDFVSNVENLGVLAAIDGTSIGGNLTLADSSVLIITATGSSEGFRLDTFDVAGLAALGGTLIIDFDVVHGTDITDFGGLYRFIDAGEFTGEFLDIEIRGVDLELVSLVGDGAFRIVPAGPATIPLIAGIFAAAARRRD